MKHTTMDRIDSANEGFLVARGGPGGPLTVSCFYAALCMFIETPRQIK
jgi:hypothetical protein